MVLSSSGVVRWGIGHPQHERGTERNTAACHQTLYHFVVFLLAGPPPPSASQSTPPSRPHHSPLPERRRRRGDGKRRHGGSGRKKRGASLWSWVVFLPSARLRCHGNGCQEAECAAGPHPPHPSLFPAGGGTPRPVLHAARRIRQIAWCARTAMQGGRRNRLAMRANGRKRPPCHRGHPHDAHGGWEKE